jgi:type IV pilus assembly protein PilW
MKTYLSKQAGLSLVELLIALALSSFLILGVTQIYVDNKRNYLFQQGQIGNLENGRYSLMVLENQLAKTGYRRRPEQSMEEAFPAGTFAAGGQTCSFAEGIAVTKVDDNTICLRYHPRDTEERDCSGAALSAANLAAIDNPYTLPVEAVVERISVTGNQLVCNGEALVDGVGDVVFDFGVGDPGVREVSSYTLNPTDRIRSIRYQLLMESEGNVSDGMTNQAYCEWNNISPCTAAPDNTLYQIVSSGMTLRNLMP